MDDGKAREIATEFNLAEKFEAAFLKETGKPLYKNEIRDAMFAHKDRLHASVDDSNEGKTFGNIKAAMKFLATDTGAGATAMERAKTLTRFNFVFDKGVNNLSGKDYRPKEKFGSKPIREMTTEIFDGGHSTSPGIYSFAIRVGKPAFQYVLNMREAFDTHGGAKTTVYEVVKYFYKNGFEYDYLRQETVVQIDQLRTKAAPNTKFRGFDGWGPGNAKDKTAETNLKNHFLKHVADSDPLKSELEWKDELPVWWRNISIKLTRKQARDNLDGGPFGKVDAMFGEGGDDAVLPYGQVVAFIAALRVGDTIGDRLAAFLWNKYGEAYRHAGLTIGRNLQDGLVHGSKADRRVVFVSGRSGDFFVVGRMAGGDLGISSCYVARVMQEKLDNRVEIWPVL